MPKLRCHCGLTDPDVEAYAQSLNASELPKALGDTEDGQLRLTHAQAEAVLFAQVR